ncbi:bile acid:sodium symporter family protein [Heliorestis acidaminivorans]|uniref:Bile acid:sodium symporter family protein n=1 Tax=Heliorestis acidaminivorans TaxID=553427 RepID=A0A6I0ET43_9FIRM|nr:bile acid:sodium symporter family protein [Heliorestis acidaminivorans]KAB2953098.1 bile acid:sodium symporter family protein [Heliorestis acidaminivorans]
MSNLAHWLIRFNSLFDRAMFFLVPSAIYIGYLFWPYLEQGRIWVYFMFAYMTFVGALNCSRQQFKALLKAPGLFIAALALVHLFIPLLAFICGSFFFPDDPLTVAGMIIASTLPVAITAAIWTYISGGNNLFVLALVVIDTLLSPIILPITTYTVFGTFGILPLDRLIQDMLLMVVVPSVLGVLLHPYRTWSPQGPTQATLNIFTKLFLLLVVAINVAILHEFFVMTWAEIGKLLTALAVLVILAYLSGYLLGKMVGKSFGDVIALTYTGGMRNIALGVVLSVGYFDPAVSIPIVFLSLIQQPIATIAHSIIQKIKKSN